MYVQAALEERKTVTSQVETGAGAVFNYVKEKHIVDERELAASLTLSEEERAVIW